jgi:hypothetical protein
VLLSFSSWSVSISASHQANLNKRCLFLEISDQVGPSKAIESKLAPISDATKGLSQLIVHSMAAANQRPVTKSGASVSQRAKGCASLRNSSASL